MESEVKSWLHDIQNSVLEIEQFLAEKPATFESFTNDLRTRRAVERNIEIMGEAMNRILKSNPAIAIQNAKSVVDTRNRIIHGYEFVSTRFLWELIHVHLPLLKAEVAGLLES